MENRPVMPSELGGECLCGGNLNECICGKYSLNASQENKVRGASISREPKMPYPPMHYPMMMPYPKHKHRHYCMVDPHTLHKAYHRSKKTTETLKKLLWQCHCSRHPHHESSRWSHESSRWRRESSSSGSVYGTEEQDS